VLIVTSLTRYDAACAALSAAVKADEVMHVRLEAKAIEAVARVAKNLDLELDAAKLRIRAEARLGEMLRQAEEQGIIARRGGQAKSEDSESEYSPPATLKDIGIDPKLSAQSRKLAESGVAERVIERLDNESRARGRVANNVIADELGKRNAESRRQLARELSDASAALSPHGRQFGVVYADPPWSRKAGIGNRAYENHYGTMSWDDIIAMPVAKRVLPDAWLFLWIPRAHLLALHPLEIDTPIGRTMVKLPLAWAVAQAWGFDAYSTCAVWTKTDDARPADHGTGLIFWDQDEILCLFKRGRGLPMPDGARKHGSNHRERAGRHSAKPTYYRDMINDMTGGVPVLELFAREDDDHILPANFFTWGNQSRNTAESEPQALPVDTHALDDACAEPASLTPCAEDAGSSLPEHGDPLGAVEPALPADVAPGERGAGSPSHADIDLTLPDFLDRRVPVQEGRA
jgi:N6-adenosine-specific RNA methylase IME4